MGSKTKYNGKHGVLRLISKDWEGLYVGGYLVNQGSRIRSDNAAADYYTRLAKRWGFNVDKLQTKELSQEDYEMLCQQYVLPSKLSHFKTTY